jgi:hypothetical protein
MGLGTVGARADAFAPAGERQLRLSGAVREPAERVIREALGEFPAIYAVKSPDGTAWRFDVA